MEYSIKNIVLGIHIGHDRCAALVNNGSVISAIAEERLDRVKYSPSDTLPTHSINYVLNNASIKSCEINLVIITHSGGLLNAEIEDAWQKETSALLGVSRENIHLINHHLAHAYMAFYTSPFDNAAIAVADGGGDLVNEELFEAESYYLGNKDNVENIHSRCQENTIKCGTSLAGHRYDYILPENRFKKISLGKKYEQITYLNGFRFGQAGKTMGLAPYGKSYIPYKIEVLGLDVNLSYGHYLEELHSRYLESNIPYSQFIRLHSADIAYDMQNALTQALIELMRNFQKITKEKNLCLAGGVFLNSVANYKILQNSGFKNVYIPPPAGDDGLAIGAALWGYIVKLKKNVSRNYFCPYLGTKYTFESIHELLKKSNYNFLFFKDKNQLAEKIAFLLNKGNVIGVLNGKTEIGPRALGNRSILASPLIKEMKDHINQRIKYREDFRPFAPVVLEDKANKYFDISQPSPYMLFVVQVLEQFRKSLIGITHVDGSARIQTVNKKQNNFISSILEEYEILSGYPILINTSFNTASEPIVESPRDALMTYRNCELDFLIIENFLISKEKNIDSHVPNIKKFKLEEDFDNYTTSKLVM